MPEIHKPSHPHLPARSDGGAVPTTSDVWTRAEAAAVPLPPSSPRVPIQIPVHRLSDVPPVPTLSATDPTPATPAQPPARPEYDAPARTVGEQVFDATAAEPPREPRQTATTATSQSEPIDRELTQLVRPESNTDRDGTSTPPTQTPTIVVKREDIPVSPPSNTEISDPEVQRSREKPDIIVELGGGTQLRLSEENAQELLVGLVSNGVQLPQLSKEDVQALIGNLLESLGAQGPHTINQEVTQYIEQQRRAQDAPGLILRDIRESLNRDRGSLTDADINNFRTLRQSDVAGALEWSLSKLNRIEKGEVNISLTDLRALMDFLKITDPKQRATLEANRNRNKWSPSDPE